MKNKMTIKQIEELVAADSTSLRNGVFTVRHGFFYRHGGSAESYAAQVIKAVPGAVLVDKGEHYAAFRGGASVANQSHWWVKFTVAVVAVTSVVIDFSI
jgi:hypothetical protein